MPSTKPASAIVYKDGRPSASLRLEARDHGIVYRHGQGPDDCDKFGARDVWVYEDGGTYYMHYDGAGDVGWLACLATSQDLVNWQPKGPVLTLGAPGEPDSKSASYGVTFKDEDAGPGEDPWHMFYLGTPNTSPPPDRVPAFPYLTLRATAPSPAGPWTKDPTLPGIVCKPGTYYSATASPGHVIKHGGEYLQFFSTTTMRGAVALRTIGCARAKRIEGPWVPDPDPILPVEEQVENSSLYFEPTNETWFLFTNHVGIDEAGVEFTDAIWVYWTRDLNRWNAKDKAVVLDGSNCTWSNRCIGLPSVVKVGDRLALFYDAPGGDDMGHMRRNIGLAWLDLPLKPPQHNR